MNFEPGGAIRNEKHLERIVKPYELGVERTHPNPTKNEKHTFKSYKLLNHEKLNIYILEALERKQTHTCRTREQTTKNETKTHVEPHTC